MHTSLIFANDHNNDDNVTWVVTTLTRFILVLQHSDAEPFAYKFAEILLFHLKVRHLDVHYKGNSHF